MPEILCTILAATVVGLAVALVKTRRALASDLEKATRISEEITREENRVFAFLHGLGEALATDATPSRMYTIIVAGARDVTGANGGALYLTDPNSPDLIPTFISKSCPPVIPLPADIVANALRNPKTAGSYMRLATVPASQGLVGKVFATDTAARIDDLSTEDTLPVGQSSYDTELHRDLTVMAAPLTHGNTHLGVLAVAGKIGDSPFTDHDFDVFRSVAEQAAFALGNALIHQEANDKRRIEDELKAASEIQRILLPKENPTVEGYDVAGENYPAKIVSGDYYDFIHVDDDHLGLVIADVSGKGIPASLIMAMCRSTLRANALGNHSPAAVLAAVNRHIFPDIREDMFISMAYTIVHKASGKITIARAGHDPPLHYRSLEERIETIKPPGLAVGIDAGPVFERVTKDHSFVLEPGDSFLLYTDGINEALDEKGDEFGLDRLESTFEATATGGAEAVISAIITDVREHVGDTRQSDDITLIAIEKR